jgi:hypothetical protein
VEVTRRPPRGNVAGIESHPSKAWPTARGRVSLDALGSQPGHGSLAANCIGKPGWWERRLAGGQA